MKIKFLNHPQVFAPNYLYILRIDPRTYGLYSILAKCSDFNFGRRTLSGANVHSVRANHSQNLDFDENKIVESS